MPPAWGAAYCMGLDAAWAPDHGRRRPCGPFGDQRFITRSATIYHVPWTSALRDVGCIQFGWQHWMLLVIFHLKILTEEKQKYCFTKFPSFLNLPVKHIRTLTTLSNLYPLHIITAWEQGMCCSKSFSIYSQLLLTLNGHHLKHFPFFALKNTAISSNPYVWFHFFPAGLLIFPIEDLYD